MYKYKFFPFYIKHQQWFGQFFCIPTKHQIKYVHTSHLNGDVFFFFTGRFVFYPFRIFSIGSPQTGWIDPDYSPCASRGILRLRPLLPRMLLQSPSLCSTYNWFDTNTCILRRMFYTKTTTINTDLQQYLTLGNSTKFVIRSCPF